MRTIDISGTPVTLLHHVPAKFQQVWEGIYTGKPLTKKQVKREIDYVCFICKKEMKQTDELINPFTCPCDKWFHHNCIVKFVSQNGVCRGCPHQIIESS